jgi:hypothetical protein
VCKTGALPLDEPGLTRTTHSLPDTTGIVQGKASNARDGDASPLEMPLRFSGRARALRANTENRTRDLFFTKEVL